MPSFPKILGYKVFFWSNEGKPIEPIHIHVSMGSPSPKATKLWILSTGKIELAENTGNIPDKDISKLIRALEDYSDMFIKKWESYHQVKAKYRDLQN